jgi:hypothetical protein
MLRRRHLLLATAPLAGCMATTPTIPAEPPPFSKVLLLPMLDERVEVRIVDKTRLSGTLGKQQLPPMVGLNRAVLAMLQTSIRMSRPEAIMEVLPEQDRASDAFDTQSRISGFWTSRNRQWAMERAKSAGADTILLIDDAGEAPEYSSKNSDAAVSYGKSLASSEVRIYAAARIRLHRADGSVVSGRYSNTSAHYPLSDFQINSLTEPMAIGHAHATISRAIRAHMFGAVRDAAIRLGILRVDASSPPARA